MNLAGRLGRAVVQGALLLWAVASLVFLLVEASPGTVVDKHVPPDAPAEVREATVRKLGLDRPVGERYLRHVASVAAGDLGRSLVHERPVTHLVADALPNTVLLAGLTLLLAFPLGTLAGLAQARLAGPAGTLAGAATAATYALPPFLLAVVLQALAPTLGLPLAGLHDAVAWEEMDAWARWVDVGRHLVLPVIALGASLTAAVARHTQASLREVLAQDFILAARLRGLSERRVLLAHALPNALLPVVTLLGLALPGLVGGSALVETLFAWPGMGRLLVDAILEQDGPVVVGCVLLYALVVLVGRGLADAVQAAIDPRVRDA